MHYIMKYNTNLLPSVNYPSEVIVRKHHQYTATDFCDVRRISRLGKLCYRFKFRARTL